MMEKGQATQNLLYLMHSILDGCFKTAFFKLNQRERETKNKKCSFFVFLNFTCSNVVIQLQFSRSELILSKFKIILKIAI